jgi:hypothetical protein
MALDSQPSVVAQISDVEESGEIHVRLRTLTQLFNSMDPSPFHDRDLDPEAEEWIVSSAQEAPEDAKLRLVLHLETTTPNENEDKAAEKAVHAFFHREAELSRRKLRQLLRRGRKSLVIALSVVGATLLGGDLLHPVLGGGHFADVVRESLLIGGWVAMWRPLEVFLYDWWPIRGEEKIFLRLATMNVMVQRCGLRCARDLATEGVAVG